MKVLVTISYNFCHKTYFFIIIFFCLPEQIAMINSK